MAVELTFAVLSALLWLMLAGPLQQHLSGERSSGQASRGQVFWEQEAVPLFPFPANVANGGMILTTRSFS